MFDSPRTSRTARALSVVLIFGMGIAGLSACTSGQNPPEKSKTPATQPSHPEKATPSSTPTPTVPPWSAVTLSCDQILTPQQIYNFNPNFGTDPNYTAATTGDVGTIAAGHGVTCGLLNQTSGEKIEFAIGKPPASVQTDLENAAITNSHAVPTYNVPEGYFDASGGTGEAQAFQGGYWVVMTSSVFLEPGDAAPLMIAALGNLPKG